MFGNTYLYSNFGYCLLGRIIEKVSGLSYLNFLRQTFNVDVLVAQPTQDKLLPNETNYYSRDQDDCFNMPLQRMDSSAGLIISTQELVRFANMIPDKEIDQRGSLDGCESLLQKRGPWVMAICCNRRKSYEFKLPLKQIFETLID